MPRLQVDVAHFIGQAQLLDALVDESRALLPRYRKLVAEIVVLRLFDLLQAAFAAIAAKLVCGACYLDGSRSYPLVSVRSAPAAFAEMKCHGRAKSMGSLTWSKAEYVKGNLRFVLGEREHYVIYVDRNATFIEEIRKVRNRIAHNNAGSRRGYRSVLQHRYGACPNVVTPGLLLISPRWSPMLVKEYLSKAQILVKALAKAP